jgi:hypothetical protein
MTQYTSRDRPIAGEKPTYQFLSGGRASFRIAEAHPALALRNATSARIGLRHPIFGHLSNIAQRQHARRVIVLAWRASG